jgi:chromosome segregation ATPase
MDADTARNIIAAYGKGESNESRLLVELAQAWLDHEAQVENLRNSLAMEHKRLGEIFDEREILKLQVTELKADLKTIETEFATLTQANECERQATRDAQAVMERCEEENERLRAQVGELSGEGTPALEIEELQAENASLRAALEREKQKFRESEDLTLNYIARLHKAEAALEAKSAECAA